MFLLIFKSFFRFMPYKINLTEKLYSSNFFDDGDQENHGFLNSSSTSSSDFPLVSGNKANRKRTPKKANPAYNQKAPTMYQQFLTINSVVIISNHKLEIIIIMCCFWYCTKNSIWKVY